MMKPEGQISLKATLAKQINMILSQKIFWLNRND